MNLKVKFLYGLSTGLASASIVPGQVYICTDNGTMFVDTADNKRIEIASLAELEKALTDLTGVVEGLAGLIGTLPEGVSNIMSYIGNLPATTDAATIVAYIDEKTAGIATDAALAELQAAVDVLEEASATHATKSEVEAVDAKFADYTKTADQEAIDAAQDAKIKAITDDYVKAADIADFETKANVKKVADDLAELDGTVKGMYTNSKIDELIQGAKDYADTNDADTKYGITYDSDAKKIKLVEGGTSFEIDATAFIKDGMIESVTLDENNDLVITFNTEAGKDDIVLPLDKLIDVYTGKATDDIIVTTNGNEISATLTEAVKASLAKADAADANAQGYANTAEQNAKDYADDLDEAMAARVKKLEDNEAGYATTDEVATAKQEAIAAAEAKAAELDAVVLKEAQDYAKAQDEALHTDISAEIDADVILTTYAIMRIDVEEMKRRFNE